MIATPAGKAKNRRHYKASNMNDLPPTTTTPPSYALQDYLVLPTIVFAQFAGTSLWFAPNAVVSQIDGFGDTQVATLVSCVQIGFIVGTLLSTYFAITDRVIPSILFVAMTLVGAILNFICVFSENFVIWAILRLFVGICLASVYPVGMKIAAMEYPNGLGARLGILVGALTLGTAFPWLVKGVGSSGGTTNDDGTDETEQKQLPVATTLASVSILAAAGAACMAIVMIPRQRRRKETSSETIPATKAQHVVSTNDDDEEVAEVAEQSIFDNQREKSNVAAEEQNDAAVVSTEQQQLTGIDAFKALTSDSRFRASALGYFGHMFVSTFQQLDHNFNSLVLPTWLLVGLLTFFLFWTCLSCPAHFHKIYEGTVYVMGIYTNHS